MKPEDRAGYEAQLQALGLYPQAGGTTAVAPPLNDFPARHRAACAELAVARERQLDPQQVERLEALVTAGHNALYGNRAPAWPELLAFFSHGLPRAIQREARWVLASATLLFLPMLVVGLVLQYHPGLVYLLLPPEQVAQYEHMYSPQAARLGWHGDRATSEWYMFGYYIANNVGIDLQCFASGLLFGLGAVFYLVYNGLTIGAVAGHLTGVGLGESFWGFVAGHSAPELLGAALSGAAGLKLGFALLAPGRWPRAVALRHAAHAATPLLIGAAALTLFAAFVEAFWSSQRALPLELKLGVGALAWTLLLTWFWLGGRRAA